MQFQSHPYYIMVLIKSIIITQDLRDIITYVGSENPVIKNFDIIAEDIAITPVFIDTHSHIGMARARRTRR